MKKIGILGGGQLARMLVLAGIPLGLEFEIFDPSSLACAGNLAPLTVGQFTDLQALQRFADRQDVLTFDFENVPASSVQLLSAHSVVWPGPQALAAAQDRLQEKMLFRQLQIPVADFVAVACRRDLDDALHQLGRPCILKTRRFGYDGKGQYRIYQPADVDLAWRALGQQAQSVGLIAEAFLPFEREVSLIAVRNQHGDLRTWTLTENWHVDGILSASLACPQDLTGLHLQAESYVRRLSDQLAYVGVLALEMFVYQGKLLANEMAPRVHNSGHWTIEGANTSQFANHLRAIMQWPLGDVSQRGQVCMLNWLGQLPSMQDFLSLPAGKWHDYGKQARPGRKTGHGTIQCDQQSELITALNQLSQVLGRPEQIKPVLARLRCQEAL